LAGDEAGVVDGVGVAAELEVEEHPVKTIIRTNASTDTMSVSQLFLMINLVNRSLLIYNDKSPLELFQNPGYPYP
jgi:hypothetical protein